MWYWIQSEQCLSIIHTISNPIICFIYFFFVIFKFIQLTVIIFNFNFFIDKYNNSKHCFVVFQYIQLNILMKNEQNEFQFLEVANNDTWSIFNEDYFCKTYSKFYTIFFIFLIRCFINLLLLSIKFHKLHDTAEKNLCWEIIFFSLFTTLCLRLLKTYNKWAGKGQNVENHFVESQKKNIESVKV